MIKLYQNFEELFLEVCITDKDRARFEKQYFEKSFTSPVGKEGYLDRMLRDQDSAWGIEYRVYFKTSKSWVLDSLKKLGYYVEKNVKNIISPELDKVCPNHGYKLRVANKDFFWQLVDYGYRLGKNQGISYTVAREMKKRREE